MPFIDPVPEDQVSNDAKTMYEGAMRNFGYLPNLTRAFSHRPEVMHGWEGLMSSIRRNMDLRRYELVTLAAARELRSSYCLLAHGGVLMKEFLTAEELLGVMTGAPDSGLDARDAAIMAFAGKVVRDATSITDADVSTLREHGLTDAEIFDVAAAAALRCFFSKTLDALGFLPDARFRELEPALREALVAGRPIEEA